VRVIYSEKHRLHNANQIAQSDQPFATLEVPARADEIIRAVRSSPWAELAEPTDHGLEPILAVHDADFVDFLRTAYAEEAQPVFVNSFIGRRSLHLPRSIRGLKGYYAFGDDSPILQGTWEAAYWSAQCALTGAEWLQAGEPAVYALCRPPGHHAASDLYGGTCYLNNAAIAARYLGAPTAILDIDYHHGNGTQDIFYADKTVLHCSLHADPDVEYPYFWGGADERGDGPGKGYNWNWPLPLGTTDVSYLETLQEALAVVSDFAPTYLVISAGFDIVANDPWGGFRVTTKGLHQIGRRIAALLIRTLIVQEGGYLLDKLGEDAVAFLQAFVQHP